MDFDRLHTAAAPPGFAVAEPTGSAGLRVAAGSWARTIPAASSSRWRRWDNRAAGACCAACACCGGGTRVCKGRVFGSLAARPAPTTNLNCRRPVVHGAKRVLTPYDGTHVAVLGFGGHIRQPDRSDLDIRQHLTATPASLRLSLRRRMICFACVEGNRDETIGQHQQSNALKYSGNHR